MNLRTETAKDRGKRHARWEREESYREETERLRPLLAQDAETNRCGRERDADAAIARESRREIEFAVGGSCILLEKEPGYEAYEGAKRAKRGRIQSFSNRSRQRLLQYGARLRTDARPLMITLTYPEWWPDNWQTWKYHLDLFWKRLRYEWSSVAILWKLEAQKRDAPHFHLLVFGIPFVPHEWVARAWFEIVGTNDPAHLAAGTRVEMVRSVRGVQAYLGKKYMGKTFAIPDSWVNPGRMWGVRGRLNAPVAPLARFRISYAEACRFRRLVRRFFKSRGRKVRKLERMRLGRICLFTQNIAEWARALDHCGGLDIVARGLGVPLECTPF